MAVNPDDSPLKRQSALDIAEGIERRFDIHKYDPHRVWQLRAAWLARWVRILQGESGPQLLMKVAAHLEELGDAWRRGIISEHDGHGGMRSNRNQELLTKINEIIKTRR